ncbi:hypothetical protein O5O45_26245 [Hahella aquimaris]|uniref:Imm52 family immunity protein n=1 Tax=Hahella sp. HNIBRBA332 TaxID=3015983 RepID=UPI00273BB8C6|nr:Imm52 family immunity protein [Hahella sp. HNIBRBA332]WLQ13236.1 hypothetical protein O5O45_26245 [Hahella sp. HNIBRBA332]
MKVVSYWGPRKEEVGQCADRLILMFSNLAEVSPLFSCWCKKANSRKKALSEEPIDWSNKDNVVSELLHGASRYYDSNEVIEDLGYRVGWWNKGNDKGGAEFGVRCALYNASSGLRNSVVITIPKALISESGLSTYKKLITGVVEAWEPEWGGVCSLEDLAASQGPNKVGKVVFINGKTLDIKANSSLRELEKFGDGMLYFREV